VLDFLEGERSVVDKEATSDVDEAGGRTMCVKKEVGEDIACFFRGCGEGWGGVKIRVRMTRLRGWRNGFKG
jgi:hypothetical protein